MLDEEVHGLLRSLHDRLTLLEARAPTGGRSAVYSGDKRFQYARDRESAIHSVARPSDEDMLKYFLNQVERLKPNDTFGVYTLAQLFPIFWQSNVYRHHKEFVLSILYENKKFRDIITSVWYSNASDPLEELPQAIAGNVDDILGLIWTFTTQPSSTPREIILKCFLYKLRKLRPDWKVGHHTYDTIIQLFWQSDYYREHPQETLNHLFHNAKLNRALQNVWFSTVSDPFALLQPGIVEDIMGIIWMFTFQSPAH